MKIRFNNKRPIAGEWTITLALGKLVEYREFGWRWGRFGIFKLEEEIIEAQVIRDADLKGFIWEWFYWLPFERRY